MRHPDSYLPPLNNLSETDGETNPQCYNFKCQADVEDEKRKLSGKFKMSEYLSLFIIIYRILNNEF